MVAAEAARIMATEAQSNYRIAKLKAAHRLGGHRQEQVLGRDVVIPASAQEQTFGRVVTGAGSAAVAMGATAPSNQATRTRPSSVRFASSAKDRCPVLQARRLWSTIDAAPSFAFSSRMCRSWADQRVCTEYSHEPVHPVPVPTVALATPVPRTPGLSQPRHVVASKMAMIAITIISSIRVKPLETRFMFFTTIPSWYINMVHATTSKIPFRNGMPKTICKSYAK